MNKKRGQKNCPKCNTIVGARTLSCPNCLYEWGKRKLKIVKSIEQKEGQGKRECNYCGYINGVRRQVCSNCGKTIEKKKIIKEIKQEKGRGRKKCSCGYFNGVKNKVCIKCGQELVKIEIKSELPEKYKNLLNIISKPIKHFTPNDHAQRIMKYGKQRAKSLKFLAEKNKNWNHVNWNMIN